MNTYADKTQENKSNVEKAAQQSGEKPTFQFTDNRPKAIQMQKLHDMVTNRPQMNKVAQLQQRPGAEKIIAPVTTPVVQRLGTNVNLVAEDDRHFETPSGKTRLRVNPDADAYLEDRFEKGSASKHADASLGDKFTHAIDHVQNGIPYNRQGKIDALNEHRQPVEGGAARKERGLGVMLHGNAATCWEKAAFFHLVLAELGIPTTLEGGYKKDDGEGHAWLVVRPHPDFFEGKSVVIDPTSGEVANRAKYERLFNITVPAKAIATPNVAQSPQDIEKALREFNTISGLGGIIKKNVVEVVELKIERAINDRRRAAEREEFEKLLAGLKF